jgi:putative Holliday junction resolvase
MRILAIDYGERYLGMAVTDALGIIPQGLPNVVRTEIEADLTAIERLVREREVKEIVLGLPKRMDDTLGPAAAKVLEFAERLKARFGLPVHLVDERLTSAHAHRLMTEAGVPTPKKRSKEHGFAAQVILRTYLAQRKRSGQ